MSSSFSELLAQRQFMRFWLARICGITAHQMLMLAISWHMYELTNSAWDLGLVGLFQFIPALLMALPAGHVIDRLHRGRIFATCMAVLVLISVVLSMATLHEQVSRGLIFGVAFVLGLTRAFQMPAQQAITPLLVPKSLFQRAVALSSTGVQVAVICGPALGGFLYLGGALTVYRVCAVLFTLSMLLTLWVRYEHVARHHSLSWQSLFAGVAFVWQRKVLLGAISGPQGMFWKPDGTSVYIVDSTLNAVSEYQVIAPFVTGNAVAKRANIVTSSGTTNTTANVVSFAPLGAISAYSTVYVNQTILQSNIWEQFGTTLQNSTTTGAQFIRAEPSYIP